jgi:rSAM/selenodomain-associated transferase 2
MGLSIIIPTLNEADVLGQTLEGLSNRSAEIIVVDGGSTDETVKIARQYTSRVLISARGRGPQQDAGARQSRGSILLFLHADTRLPGAYERLICEAFADKAVVFGAFRLKIVPPSPALDLIALMANLRSRFLRLPYGDQALFVRRRAYFQAGGFEDWPVMEDVELVRRLNRVGAFRLVRSPVETSARRWRGENCVYATFRNWTLILRYLAGVHPRILARAYPNARNKPEKRKPHTQRAVDL